MLDSVKIAIKAIAVLLFVTGCTTQTSNLHNQVIEDADALTKITAESVNGPIGLFHVIARAGSFNHTASIKSLRLEYAKLQAGLSSLEVIPNLEATASSSMQDRNVGGSSAQLINGVVQANDNANYSVSSDRREQNSQLSANLSIAQLGVAGLNSTISSQKILVAAQEERSALSELALRGVYLYWAALASQKLERDINATLQDVSDATSNSKEQLKFGLIEPLQALTVQRELLSVTKSLRELARSNSNSSIELKQLVGVMPSEELKLTTVNAPNMRHLKRYEDDLVITTAIANHSQYLSVFHESVALDAEEQKIFWDLLPQVNLSASSIYDDNPYKSENNWLEMRSVLSWNILNALKLKPNLERVRLQKLILEKQRQREFLNLVSLLQIAVEEVRQNEARLLLAKEYVSVSEKVLEQLEAQITSERATAISVIKERQNLIQAEFERDLIFAELQESYFRLYFAMGLDLFPPNWKTLSPDELPSALQNQFKRLAEL